MNEYFPTVVQVIPLDNFHVQVFFDDGKIFSSPVNFMGPGYFSKYKICHTAEARIPGISIGPEKT